MLKAARPACSVLLSSANEAQADSGAVDVFLWLNLVRHDLDVHIEPLLHLQMTDAQIVSMVLHAT